ncbi:DUF4468 domain-containing protein [Spirosoma radiotolerans]|uniref:DUF4468 domain-containing protein n=1 Tax=Spirosoma radiotolerans TaxID=1379870 RepID=A0A0E3V5B6_9BACT|nr:DUF4468 domain-containing protein [Spirosoma radiotolerans]AKD54012.1 hypothetical protein SD10_02920 [Spirosoma radiotolerans]
MRLFLIGLFMACLVNPSYGIVDCPPVITNGKLLGILPVVNQKVSYSDVVDCGAVSQADLFRRVRLWAAQSCYSPGDTFSMSDKETGDLVGRVSQVVTLLRSENSVGGVYTFRYSLIIECTNRKYRVTITQLDVLENGTKTTPIESYCQKNEVDLRAIYTALDTQINHKLTSLQKYIENYKPF